MARLRDENRWYEACDFKEQRRLQARADGLSRVDSVEHAWIEMAKAYPPLSDEEIDGLPAVRFMTIANFPPELLRNLDTGDGLLLQDLWRATCFAVASELALAKKSQFGWLSVIGSAMERIHDSATSDISKDSLGYAIWQPRGFLLGFALQRFEALLGDETQLGEHAGELRCFAKSIVRLRTESVFDIFGAEG